MSVDPLKLLQDQNQGLIHQLNAAKAMLGDHLGNCLQLKAQLLQQNQNNLELAKKLADEQFNNKKLNDDNAAHLAKITELDAKLNPPAAPVPDVIPDNGQ